MILLPLSITSGNLVYEISYNLLNLINLMITYNIFRTFEIEGSPPIEWKLYFQWNSKKGELPNEG